MNTNPKSFAPSAGVPGSIDNEGTLLILPHKLRSSAQNPVVKNSIPTEEETHDYEENGRGAEWTNKQGTLFRLSLHGNVFAQ
jgi:hypothetical protein